MRPTNYAMDTPENTPTLCSEVCERLRRHERHETGYQTFNRLAAENLLQLAFTKVTCALAEAIIRPVWVKSGFMNATRIYLIALGWGIYSLMSARLRSR